MWFFQNNNELHHNPSHGRGFRILWLSIWSIVIFFIMSRFQNARIVSNKIENEILTSDKYVGSTVCMR